MTWTILRLFFISLTGDEKYSLLNRGNLTQHIQMHLPQKQKYFSELFFKFSESNLNFEHFQKKMTLIAYVFPQVRTLKYVVRKMSKKSCLREPLDRQHGKLAETLVQSQLNHLYHIH